MSQPQFDRMCSIVTQAMTAFVGQFVTPLSVSEEPGKGYAWGSGTYIFGPDAIWVLTAGHVITDVPDGGRLAHMPAPGGQYNAMLGVPVWKPAPIDAGALPVSPQFPFRPIDARVMRTSAIAVDYRPAKDELLFWLGFPSFRLDRMAAKDELRLRVSMFGELESPAKPMLTQALPDSEMIGVPFFDPTYQIGMHYPETGTRAKDLVEMPLPFAAGMSGSALWDTKAVASMVNGTTWSPEMAEICGVIRAAHTKPVQVVTTTKIEHVRAALPEVFRPASELGG